MKSSLGGASIREQLTYIFQDLDEGYMKNGEYIYRDMDTCVNEALTLIESITKEARKDQIMQDFLTYNIELPNDESELIAVKELCLAQLLGEKK